jgi:stage V sporulation protein G
MEITEVRIFPRESRDKKLKAYATVTFDDCFVVRDIKVIQGNKGLFVAMPSRKMKESCSKCGHRNVVRSKYCNACGATLPITDIVPTDKEERQSEHRDIAHPINSEFREHIQKAVLNKYDSLPESEKASGVDAHTSNEDIDNND